MATKRVEKPAEPAYDEVTICDRCGEEALQDDALRQDTVLGIGPLAAHGRCWEVLKDDIRRSLGLYT